MFLADGGGGGTAAPSYAGTQTLQLEPSAIPGAIKAFQAAADRVQAKVNELSGMRIQAWAHDEVSSQTAIHFIERSQGGGDSAMQCLTAYSNQLNQALGALRAIQSSYQGTETDNTTTFRS